MTQPRHGARGEQRGDSTRTGEPTGERGGGANAAEAKAGAGAGAGEAGEVVAAAAAEGEAAAEAEGEAAEEEAEEAEAVATFERCLVPCCREAEVWLVLSRAPTLSLTQP